ncbi:hypothetical protein J2S09_000663 [Bacillus fengqiuensis]|nr:hypothetical protein [Bacillus fengqiuensis]
MKLINLIFLSFLPGVGHFYLRMPNRGFQLLMVYSFVFFMTVKTGLFPKLAVAFWIISFLDSVYHYHRIRKGEEELDQFFLL